LLENISCTLSTIENSVNLWSFFQSQILNILIILFTVLVTVHYSEYQRDARAFKAIIEWFYTELVLIQFNLEKLKRNVQNIQTKLRERPTEKSYNILIFSNRSFESYNEFITKGFAKYLTSEEIIEMSTLYMYFEDIALLEKQYLEISSLIAQNITINNYYDVVNDTLEQLIAGIDRFNEKNETYRKPIFPSFYRRILGRTKKNFEIIAKRFFTV